MIKKLNKILIFWEGFPPCGLLLSHLKTKFGSNLTILATRAKVNFPDFAIEYPNLNIRWLDEPNQIWSLREEYNDFSVILHTGWNHPGWVKYSFWMKRKGARIIFSVDNIYKSSIRQLLGAIYFRIKFRNKYDAVFVPGIKSKRFMSFLGMPNQKIFIGYYGAFEHLYSPGKEVSQRNQDFLFVGQLIPRKGIDILLKAYTLYRSKGGKWNLRISGSGKMADLCVGEGVIFEGFLPPKNCSIMMKEARCLILPSREEHWGTVACEAAASGMLLLLSTSVGACEDILRDGINGLSFENKSHTYLANKMFEISNWEEQRLNHGGEVSTSISKGFDSQSFYSGFLTMIESLS